MAKLVDSLAPFGSDEAGHPLTKCGIAWQGTSFGRFTPLTVLHFIRRYERCDLATTGLCHVLFGEVGCVGGKTKRTYNIASDSIEYGYKREVPCSQIPEAYVIIETLLDLARWVDVDGIGIGETLNIMDGSYGG